MQTTSQTTTLFLLPIITYVITSVISGNIALSLGMVGALSIVRFRNPVRSPLELTTYFSAITAGITASVSEMWLAILYLGIFSVVIILYLLNKLSNLFTSVSFFTASFAEGNELSTLRVTADNAVKLLEAHPNLLSASFDAEKKFEYTISSGNFEELRKLASELKETGGISTIAITK